MHGWLAIGWYVVAHGVVVASCSDRGGAPVVVATVVPAIALLLRTPPMAPPDVLT